MNPIGKYFKTRYDYYYCYAEDTLWKSTWACIKVDGVTNNITTVYLNHPISFPKSTRKAFMKAYEKTMDKIDGIVDGKI